MAIPNMVAQHDKAVTIRSKSVRDNVRVGVVLVYGLVWAIYQKLSNFCQRLALVEVTHVHLVHVEHGECAVAQVGELLDN